MPIPPTIPGTANFKSMRSATFQAPSLTITNNGNISFFGNTPAEQREGPTPVITPTTESNYEMIQNILATLRTYGLIKDADTPPVTGRTITFTNNSSTEDITIYLTVGAPEAAPPTLIATLPIGDSYEWPIPETVNWSGNFQFWVSGQGPAEGSTLFEVGLNQLWSGIEPPNPLRDTFDISTVPPGLGDLYANGPRADAVAYSLSQGFTTQQSRGYSVGLLVTPPPAPVNPPRPLVTVPVTADDVTGNCPEAITYPNDTAYPKQQTGYAEGNYTVSIIDPVSIDLP